MGTIVQVVNGDGDFAESQLQDFFKDHGVDNSGVNYTIVAIMGPQSSGKSTLLNHLFGTRFEEMDALSGRQQTTHGIWLSSSPKITAPPTLIMDLEGSDGRERGEDDTSFERQSALFALATADILLVNMWAKDVGRETGAGKPLLKTIFQVNLKLFQPSPGARRTVLLFVFRDRTRTPLEKLKETWEQDLGSLWDSLTKPAAYAQCAISDFFDVQYCALSNYEDKQEDFLAETTILRRRFTEDVDESEGYLRPPTPQKLPGQALALSMSKVWEVIHHNKDLNLPAHRVMVANIRCSEISKEVSTSFASSVLWVKLASEAEEDLVPGFGVTASKLLDEAIESYTQEARYFDQSVSIAQQEKLIDELHGMIRPVFDMQLSLARGVALESYQSSMMVATGADSNDNDGTETFVQRSARCAEKALAEFDTLSADILLPTSNSSNSSAIDEQWSASTAREALQRDITAHESKLRQERIDFAVKTAITTVESAVSVGVSPLFESSPVDLWIRVSRVVEKATHHAVHALTQSLHGYGVAPTDEATLADKVATAAKACLQTHAKEAANTALPRIKDRFSESFHKDEQGMPRTWTASVDITAVARDARHTAAMLLAQLCVMRLSNSNSNDQSGGVIEAAIMKMAADHQDRSLTGAPTTTTTTTTINNNNGDDDFDLLSASSWPGIPSEDVLLTPAQVRTIWRQFSSDSALAVQQAVATQQANKLAQNRMPPIWAIVAMIVLGFNEFVAVLKNPLYLILVIFVVAFAKTVYQELDVEAEMQRGLLPGAMALSAKFMPTVQAVARRTFESGRAFLEAGGEGSDGDGGIGRSDSSRMSTTSGAVTGGSGGEGLRRRREGEVELTHVDNKSSDAFVVNGRKDD